MAETQPPVAHHFATAEQEHEAHTLGMWVFLITEVLFFGGLFTAYAIYRTLYPQAFAEASQHLDVLLGSANTGVLLGSSLTMALAVHAAAQNKRRPLVLFLLLTAALGALFLGIKGVEYYKEYQEHLIPWLNFQFEGAHAPQARLFFVLYFFMTGLHAIHLTLGILVVGLLSLYLWRQQEPRRHITRVELVGLYWHFVDVVWIFLFPLLYLIDLHR